MIATFLVLAAAWLAPNPERIEEIAKTLPERAVLPYATIGDRGEWERIAVTDSAKTFVARAAKMSAESVPELTDFLEFSRNGNRHRYESPYFKRLKMLQWFTIAERLEDAGRFLPHVERCLRAIADERTWVLPAHDSGLRNWNGQGISVDLFSAERAWGVALTLRLLEGRIAADLDGRLRRLVRERVIGPYLDSARGLTDSSCRAVGSWPFNRFNWNRVCHAGCCSAVLLLCDDRADRAAAIEFVERALPVYLSGFGSDGYCEEGMDYWNYGFGNHLLLALAVRQTTGGKVDLLAGEENRRAALYAQNYPLDATGLSPAFADGGGKPFPALLTICAGVWPKDFIADRVDAFGACDNISFWPPAAMFAQRAFGSASSAVAGTPKGLPIRSAFETAGVYVFRAAGGFSVAVKAKNSGLSHSHNDAGSYAVGLNGVQIAGDPGGENYTGRTFSSRRFESKVLNSYGHPVPMVDGCLQEVGGKIRTKVVNVSFSDVRDEVSVDLTGAYPAASNLVSLVRTFTFDRGTCQFAVRDTVSFSKPSAFESATVTRTPDKLKGHLKTNATGGEWDESTEVIEDPGRASPRRTRVRFRKPVTEASVEFVFSLN